MRISDYVEFSLSNLWKMKLRTLLTTLGVIIGIGALVSMISFGRGMQENVTKSFADLELFNSITVFSESSQSQEEKEGEEGEEKDLNDNMISIIENIRGVQAAFPEVRFPALVGFNDKEEFRLVQVIPSYVAASKLMKLRFGKPYELSLIHI